MLVEATLTTKVLVNGRIGKRFLMMQVLIVGVHAGGLLPNREVRSRSFT
jgi:hypothetical protein